MSHTLQERYSNLVLAKLRQQNVFANLFNTRYEGTPKAGAVKIPVRDTEATVGTYSTSTGKALTVGATSYQTLTIDSDIAVNEIIDGYEASAVPDGLVADRLDSAGYSLALNIDTALATLLTTSGNYTAATSTATDEYELVVDAITELAIKKDEQLTFTSKLYVGIKYGVDNKNVCLSIALKTNDNRIFIECIDCRETRIGSLWMVQFIKECDIAQVIIDGKNGQDKLKKDLKDYGIKAKVILPTVSQFIEANASFRTALSTQQIVHNNQPSLRQVATNCEKRLIGSHGGFGFKSQNQDMEIGLLESAILAYWACSEAKEVKKQKVYY